MLNVALPKGRLGDGVMERFARAGYAPPNLKEGDRRLVIPCENGEASFFLVKPVDVSIYVEYGVADVGVVGSDVLEESGADVYELLDLRLGECRLAVAALSGFAPDYDRPLRVATKYPQIAKAHFEGQNQAIEIITLNGSIELAPILKLSDVILDVVETGKTLRENGLKVIQDVRRVSARLIANKPQYKFKRAEMEKLAGALKEAI